MTTPSLDRIVVLERTTITTSGGTGGYPFSPTPTAPTVTTTRREVWTRRRDVRLRDEFLVLSTGQGLPTDRTTFRFRAGEDVVLGDYIVDGSVRYSVLGLAEAGRGFFEVLAEGIAP